MQDTRSVFQLNHTRKKAWEHPVLQCLSSEGTLGGFAHVQEDTDGLAS